MRHLDTNRFFKSGFPRVRTLLLEDPLISEAWGASSCGGRRGAKHAPHTNDKAEETNQNLPKTNRCSYELMNGHGEDHELVET